MMPHYVHMENVEHAGQDEGTGEEEGDAGHKSFAHFGISR